MITLNKKPLFRTMLFTLSLMLLVGLQSCSDDDNPAPVDEEETITTMTVTLTPASGSVVTLQVQDLDGDGPDTPEITVSGPLQATTQYDGSIELLNETVNPAEDITTEVREEDEEHQFFFDFSGSVAVVSYADADANGNPVGLSFVLTTGPAGPGTLSVTLRHEPQKPNDGTLADAGGETDIAQSFGVQVQ